MQQRMAVVGMQLEHVKPSMPRMMHHQQQQQLKQQQLMKLAILVQDISSLD